MFGGDFLPYYYDKVHGTKVDDEATSMLLEYCHEYWESQYNGSKEEHEGKEQFCSPGANFISGIIQSATQQPGAAEQTAPVKQPVPAPQTVPAQKSVHMQQPAPTLNPLPKQQPASTLNPVPKQQPAPTQKPMPAKQQPTLTQKPVPKHQPAQTSPKQQPTPTQKQPVSAKQEPPLKQAKCKDSDSVSGQSTSSSPKAVVIEDENDYFKGSEQTALQLAITRAKTRGELAALYSQIPPFAGFSSSLKAVYDKPSQSDPFSVNERPCESDIQRALKLLSDERKAGKEPTGIEIEGKGQFSERALSILRRFCMITDVCRKVSSEAMWLSQMKFLPVERILLENALWHTSATSPIVRCGNKGIDPTSFSDLVEERYIDSFVVDTCISKFLGDRSVNVTNVTVYFPTDFYQWINSNDKTFQQLQLSARVEQLANINDLQQILVPVYMPNHWGLMVIDVINQELYFDDGLASAVPRNALPSVKHSLELLLEMYTYQPYLQTRFWRNCSLFKRFGMPSQAPVDSKMIGVGSCGIGVIMAARDFIKNGPFAINNFQWRFSEMDLHRKQLMLQILNWSKQH